MSETSGRRRPTLRVSAFVVHDQKVLLVRQGRPGSPPYWLLPGGAVERGESLDEALRRELWEECGLVARIDPRPLGVAESISPDGGLSRHVVHLIFAAFAVDDAGPDVAGKDPAILETRWVTKAGLAGLTLHPPVQDLLAQWLDCFESAPAQWPAAAGAGPRWAP